MIWISCYCIGQDYRQQGRSLFDALEIKMDALKTLVESDVVDVLDGVIGNICCWRWESMLGDWFGSLSWFHRMGLCWLLDDESRWRPCSPKRKSQNWLGFEKHEEAGLRNPVLLVGDLDVQHLVVMAGPVLSGDGDYVARRLAACLTWCRESETCPN